MHKYIRRVWASGKGEPGGECLQCLGTATLADPCYDPLLGSRDQTKLQPTYTRDDCRHTRVSQLEGGRDFVEEPPIHSKPLNNKTYIAHAVGYRPHTALTCLPGTYLCTRTGWMTGAVQNTCGQPRVFNTQTKARDTPIALCGRSLTPRVACVWPRLLPWERLPDTSKSLAFETHWRASAVLSIASSAAGTKRTRSCSPTALPSPRQADSRIVLSPSSST
jgi:hypothetical protein